MFFKHTFGTFLIGNKYYSLQKSITSIIYIYYFRSQFGPTILYIQKLDSHFGKNVLHVFAIGLTLSPVNGYTLNILKIVQNF